MGVIFDCIEQFQGAFFHRGSFSYILLYILPVNIFGVDSYKKKRISNFELISLSPFLIELEIGWGIWKAGTRCTISCILWFDPFSDPKLILSIVFFASGCKYIANRKQETRCLSPSVLHRAWPWLIHSRELWRGSSLFSPLCPFTSGNVSEGLLWF